MVRSPCPGGHEGCSTRPDAACPGRAPHPSWTWFTRTHEPHAPNRRDEVTVHGVGTGSESTCSAEPGPVFTVGFPRAVRGLRWDELASGTQ
ncbi:hypothetical protein GCM10025792_26290 [Pseudonocardia tropica]